MINFIDQFGSRREVSLAELPIVRSPLYIIRSHSISGIVNFVGSISSVLFFLLVFVFDFNIAQISLLILFGTLFLSVQMRLAHWTGILDYSEKRFDVLRVTNDDDLRFSEHNLHFIFLGGWWPSETPRLVTDDVQMHIGRKHTTITAGEFKLKLPNYCLAWSNGVLFSGEDWPSVQPEYDLKHKFWSGIDRKNKVHQRLIWRAMNPFS